MYELQADLTPLGGGLTADLASARSLGILAVVLEPLQQGTAFVSLQHKDPAVIARWFMDDEDATPELLTETTDLVITEVA